MAKIKLNKIEQNPLRSPPEPKKIGAGNRLIDPNDGFNLLLFIFGAIWLTFWCAISFTIFAIAAYAFILDSSLEMFASVVSI